MGIFEDFGTLIGEIAEATGECVDELIETAAGSVVDVIENPPKPPRRRRRVIIIEDAPNIFDYLDYTPRKRPWW